MSDTTQETTQNASQECMICMAPLAEQDPSDACTSCRRPFHSNCIQQWIVNSASPRGGEDRPAPNLVTLVHLLDHATARCPHCRTPAAFPTVVQRITQYNSENTFILIKVLIINKFRAKLLASDFDGLLDQAVQSPADWVHTKLLDHLLTLHPQFLDFTRDTVANALKIFIPTRILSNINYDNILSNLIRNQINHRVRMDFYSRLGLKFLFDLRTRWGKCLYLQVRTTELYLQVFPRGSQQHIAAVDRAKSIMKWVAKTGRDAMRDSFEQLLPRDDNRLILDAFHPMQFLPENDRHLIQYSLNPTPHHERDYEKEFNFYIKCCCKMHWDYQDFHERQQAKAKRARDDSDGAGSAQKRAAV